MKKSIWLMMGFLAVFFAGAAFASPTVHEYKDPNYDFSRIKAVFMMPLAINEVSMDKTPYLEEQLQVQLDKAVGARKEKLGYIFRTSEEILSREAFIRGADVVDAEVASGDAGVVQKLLANHTDAIITIGIPYCFNHKDFRPGYRYWATSQEEVYYYDKDNKRQSLYVPVRTEKVVPDRTEITPCAAVQMEIVDAKTMKRIYGLVLTDVAMAEPFKSKPTLNALVNSLLAQAVKRIPANK